MALLFLIERLTISSISWIIHTKTAELLMNVRYGNLSDATMLSELGAKTFYDAFARDNTPENIRLYIRRSFSKEIQLNELSRPEIVFLIAELEDRPVGYAKLNLNSKDESARGTKVMEIERIYASQEFIGRGVGKELMKACINEARQRGCDSIWLGVWEMNQRAIDFYAKWGFKEVGTHIFMLGNDPQKDFVMELKLG
jgi:ribosomal protein S18 acetylase RimI-like enzyme